MLKDVLTHMAFSVGHYFTQTNISKIKQSSNLPTTLRPTNCHMQDRFTDTMKTGYFSGGYNGQYGPWLKFPLHRFTRRSPISTFPVAYSPSSWKWSIKSTPYESVHTTCTTRWAQNKNTLVLTSSVSQDAAYLIEKV